MTLLTEPAQRLQAMLKQPGLLQMPCCFDALSARLIERAGFSLTLMSGFAVAATRLGAPDTGLISYQEMVEQGRDICQSVSIPVIGDADTGYGNAMNVRRTLFGYKSAGFGCAMIEDQVSPKRCGHTKDKQVVDRTQATTRIRAAVEARDEGAGILVLARTDARATHGLEEALWRAEAFADLGADLVFVEAPQSVDELRIIGERSPVPALANMLEQGQTPLLPPAELEALGYKIAAYPLTLLSAATLAMQRALSTLKSGAHPDALLDFAQLKNLVGFDTYYELESRYGRDGS